MTAESHHKAKLARLGCVVCQFALGIDDTPAQLHHVAKGSGQRSPYSMAPLCPEHHTGKSGMHSMGQGFFSLYRVPGETEYGLLVWPFEALARAEVKRRSAP